MIQNISPYRFHVEYRHLNPKESDFVLVFQGDRLLIRDGEQIAFMTWKEALTLSTKKRKDVHYLFAIDEIYFFYMQAEEERVCPVGYRLAQRQEFRSLKPKHLGFAAVTAFHLNGFYNKNQFCGCCGGKLVHDHKERMLYCHECDNRIYPRINPAVIVAVTNGDKLLLTKYNGRNTKGYALVAGFNEIGESFEDTVKREVMEETGLKVKNIRYYASQPWAFADNILAGYFCEVDGDEEIHMDEEELSLACWMKKKDIPVEWNDLSLTNEMICHFKEEN